MTIHSVLLTARTGVQPPTPGFIPDIPQFTLLALSDTQVRVTITNSGGASVFLARLNNGMPVPLAGTGIIGGLAPSTQYGVELQTLNVESRPSAWSPIVLVTTQAAPVIPGTISDLSATPLSPTTAQLAGTPSVGAAAHEFRVGSGAWTALPADWIAFGLPPATLSSITVRGINAGGTPGAASNAATVTTFAAVIFDPLTLLSPVNLARVHAEYPDAFIDATAVWGPEGIPDYADPVYDWGVTQADANLLDASDYADIPAWLADMELQGKDGKIFGNYTVAALVTSGSRSIKGYGLFRPLIQGTWIHYLVGSNITVQYIKRTNNTGITNTLAPFWIICVNNHASTFITSSNYAATTVRPTNPALRNSGDITGISFLDNEIDGVEYAFFSMFSDTSTISHFRVGRNTYRGGAKNICTINFIKGGHIYVYQNDHDGPAFHNRLASWAGTVIAVGGAGLAGSLGGVALNAANSAIGPTKINHNRARNIIATTLQRRDENIAVCMHTSQSNTIDARYNIFIDIWSPFFTVDGNAMYCKSGCVDFSENYIEGCGTGSNNHFYAGATGGGAGGYQDQSSVISDCAGNEAIIALKGGGGNVTRSKLSKMIIIPRFQDNSVFMPHHTGEMDGTLVLGWRYSGYKRPLNGLIRAAAVNFLVGPNNMFVDCGHDEFAGMQGYFCLNDGGSPGMTFQGLAVDFDGGAINALQRVPPINGNPPGITNRAGTPLHSVDTGGSNERPWIRLEPKLRLSGSDLEIYNQTWFLATVVETYQWYRDGVLISGQTASILPAAEIHGTVQGCVIGTVGSRVTKKVTDPWFELGANLVSNTSPIIAATGATTTHNKTLTSPLDVGEEYLVTFQNTPVYTGSDAFIIASIEGGTVVPDVVVPLHYTSRGGRLWRYRYTAKAGDNVLRIIRTSKWTGTVDQIAVQKINSALTYKGSFHAGLS